MEVLELEPGRARAASQAAAWLDKGLELLQEASDRRPEVGAWLSEGYDLLREGQDMEPGSVSERQE
eukprot:11433132-Alexandrium_andersonii.AAC.1